MKKNSNINNIKEVFAQEELDNCKIALDTLKTEVDNLNLLVKQFEDKKFCKSFLKVLHTLNTCNGRILVTGVGKSGNIGKKISGIFSSIGMSSFFIHPVEAIHGDLGCICKNDVLIAISCSGGTVEIKDIVNYCNKHGVKVVSITCKSGSWLEENSEINITLNMKSEAINGFPIPTTSSILTLAICDALTACLVKNKKLSNKKYGELHCGGKIGENIKAKIKN